MKPQTRVITKIIARKTDIITSDPGGNPRYFTIEITTGMVGHGTEIHYMRLYNQKGSLTQICGSGKNSLGTKRQYSTRFVDREVTCPKCLNIFEKKWKQYQIEQ